VERAGIARPEDRILLQSAFGLVFFSISVASLFAGKESTIFPVLWTSLFVVAGFYYFVGYFFWHALCRRYVEYAVTNQRVIVRSGILSETPNRSNIARFERSR
jgi:hypothetical protein